MSKRERIQAIEDRPSEEVAVTEWDDEPFMVRGLSAAAAERFSERISDEGQETPSIMAELIVMTAEDPETGELAFEPDDTAWLANKSGVALRRLFEPAQRLSGMGSLEEAKKD